MFNKMVDPNSETDEHGIHFDKLETNTTREKHIADALATYDENNHPKGETLPLVLNGISS